MISSDDFYDGVTVLPSWVEAGFAQQRAMHREARGEHPAPGRQDSDTWELPNDDE